jgi:GNAT superfamily N-acetyltransferase
LELRQLSIKEITDVYKRHLKDDFPDNERKPLFVMKSLLKRNLYQCFGLYTFPDASLKAYTFLCKGNNCNSLILDYFATVEGERGKGFGSQMLHLLHNSLQEIDGIVAEVEHAEAAADIHEKQVRQRRIDFYCRNGFTKTQVSGMIFGVHYDIVYLPIRHAADDTFVMKELEDIYRTMLPKFMYDPNVKLELRPINQQA